MPPKRPWRSMKKHLSVHCVASPVKGTEGTHIRTETIPIFKKPLF